MKQFNLTFLLTVLMSMVSAKASAHDIEAKNADGVTIYYSYINNNTELAVTYRGNRIDDYSNEYSGNVAIPESVIYNDNTYSVTSIGDYAFYKCGDLTLVTIPGSVTSIGKSAFYNCSSLTEVTMSNNVTAIGESAFCNCSSLTEVTMSNNVMALGYWVFAGCSSLTVMPIGNSVKSIGNYAFKGCSSLVKATIPNSVWFIEDYAFDGCSGLTEVTIGDSVRSIGYSVFSNCSSLEKIFVNNSNLVYDSREDCNAIIQTVENKLIAGCKNTYIPNTVTAINGRAFYGCRGLTEIIIPNSVTDIGYGVFAGCNGLEKIVVESGNLYYDSRENCNAIIQTTGKKLIAGCKNTHIPNIVMAIDISAFEGCSNLTEITIPNSVTAINSSAFKGCSGLTEITIPNSVTSVYNSAFLGCSGLRKVVIGSSVRAIDIWVFADCNSLTTLYSLNANPPKVYDYNFTDSQYATVNVYVPQEVLATYMSADVWKYFVNLQGISGTGGEMEKCATPTIHYANNTLTFECETEGVTFESKITDTDISSYSSNEIKLGVTYNISVYATKDGYEDSDKATATLCWIDVDPKTEGIDTDIALVRANAVLIQADNGQIDVTGLADGTKVTVYGIEGIQIGSAISRGGQTSINANITPGSVAIVKIGDRSVKVVVK